jgi:hypothetical protein
MISHAARVPPAAATVPPPAPFEKPPRPELLHGSTRKITSPLGDVYVTINEGSDGAPFEVFAAVGKAGSALMADVEAIGRLASLALRFGIPLEEVYRQLRGISSDRAIGVGPQKVLSVPDAIGQAIGTYLRTGTAALRFPCLNCGDRGVSDRYPECSACGHIR